MALDLEIVVKERESGIVTDRFVQLSVTARELGNLYKLIYAIKSYFDFNTSIRNYQITPILLMREMNIPIFTVCWQIFIQIHCG